MPSNRGKISEEETIDCILRIPKTGRIAIWIKSQPANVVADILGISETVHTYLKNGICTDDARRDQLLAQEKKLQEALEDALRQETLRVDSIHTTHNAIVEKIERVQDLENEMNLLKSTFLSVSKANLLKKENKTPANWLKSTQPPQNSPIRWNY